LNYCVAYRRVLHTFYPAIYHHHHLSAPAIYKAHFTASTHWHCSLCFYFVLDSGDKYSVFRELEKPSDRKPAGKQMHV